MSSVLRLKFTEHALRIKLTTGGVLFFNRTKQNYCGRCTDVF